jgi:hypothetical protein
MKNAKDILTHLFPNSAEKMSKSRFFKRAIQLLPPATASELAFCYRKEKTLFFVVKNRSMLFELDYKLKSLKEAFVFLAENEGFDEFLGVTEVKCFVSKYDFTEAPVIHPKTTYLENERASGTFENMAKDAKAFELFEDIRKLIFIKMKK